jgi:large subunit ribosomal protein L24
MGKLSVKKGDTVMVIAGKKGKEGIKGKTGKVIYVDRKNDRVIVEGLRMQKHHLKPQGAKSEAGIIEKEGPIHVSNVMVVCPKCGKPTRVGHAFDEQGNKVRVCRRKIDGQPCGGVLDKGGKLERKKAEKPAKKEEGEEKKPAKKAETEKKTARKSPKAKAEAKEAKSEAENAEGQEIEAKAEERPPTKARTQKRR